MVCEKAKEIAKASEGLFLIAYLCPAGIWTIGYGNTIYRNGTKVKKGDVITKEQANELFDFMFSNFAKQVQKVVTVPLTDNQLGALTSFAYNIGMGNFESSTLLKRLNRKDYKGAQEQFGAWVKANGKVLNGLVVRRKREAELFGMS